MYTKIIECCKKQIKAARENVGEDSIWESFAYEIMAYCEDAVNASEDAILESMIQMCREQIAITKTTLARYKED